MLVFCSLDIYFILAEEWIIIMFIDNGMLSISFKGTFHPQMKTNHLVTFKLFQTCMIFFCWEQNIFWTGDGNRWLLLRFFSSFNVAQWLPSTWGSVNDDRIFWKIQKNYFSIHYRSYCGLFICMYFFPSTDFSVPAGFPETFFHDLCGLKWLNLLRLSNKKLVIFVAFFPVVSQ